MKKRLSSIDKKSESLIVLLSISFSFTVWFFTPVEIFVRNQKDFVVGAGYIIPPMVITAVVAAVLSILLLNLLLLIHKSLFTVFSGLMTGLLLAMYVQELFFNGGMSSITGDAVLSDTVVSWKKQLNFILIYLIVMLPLILTFCGKKYHDKKLFQIGNGYIAHYLVSVIFAMQACGLVGSIAQFGVNRYPRTFDRALSFETSVSLSTDKNIIVFLLDRLDGMYMDELLENYPELYDEYEGFTFYQNNISRYSSTFPSVTNMLTTEPYENGEWVDYFSKAWKKQTFLDELKNNGYRINLLLDNSCTYTNLPDIDTRCDNIVSMDPSDYHYNYLEKKGVIPVMTSMSLGKLSPYVLKEMFLDTIESDFSNFFLTLSSREDIMPAAVGTESDLKFYNYLTDHTMTADEQKYFSFIHLNGCHDASDELSRLYDGPEKTGSFKELSTSRGDMEILFEYFRQMKELGIYDRSTIIVLGDHGHTLTLEEIDDERVVTTALLIKPENAAPQPLRTDAAPELSNAYFAASILDYAGLDHSDYGYSYTDIIDNGISTERYLQFIAFEGFGKTSEVSLYRVTGDARERGNWEVVDKSE